MARRERARRRREGELHRENVSGELEHASGEVDEFDAALVSGAQGQAGNGDPQEDLDLAAAAAFGNDGDDKVPSHPVAGPKPGGNRFLNFLRASWAELQRVQWPDRRQVAQATGVVLGFVVLAGAYLGIADWAAQRVVNFVL